MHMYKQTQKSKKQSKETEKEYIQYNTEKLSQSLMADTHFSSSLVCEEDASNLDEEEEEEEEGDVKYFSSFDDISVLSESDDEYIELLVSKESSLESKNHEEVASGNWSILVRADAVGWILKACGRLGFGLRTAYMAVAYLDRFFMRRIIDRGKAWAVRLLSIACLSLAVKMEENKAFSLSEFQSEDYFFKCEAIQRMELLVLTTLQWRMIMVNPFSYMSFFASKLQKQGRKELIQKAIAIIFSAIRVINSLDYRPSVIACASILASSDEKLSRKSIESKICSVAQLGPLDHVHVFSCYNIMIQEANKERLNNNNPNLSGTNLGMFESIIGTNNNSSSLENPCASKRRRIQSPHDD
ncbi:hypothetical protein LUZ60_005965 [Juncus effusus]|nr:hypothetical protein LUZ60_005965 [Juncus effusus]